MANQTAVTTTQIHSPLFFSKVSSGPGDSQLLFKLIYLWKARNNSKGDILLGLEMPMIDEELNTHHHSTYLNTFSSSNHTTKTVTNSVELTYILANSADPFPIVTAAARASVQQESPVVPPPPRFIPPRRVVSLTEENRFLINSFRSATSIPQETDTCMRSLRNLMTRRCGRRHALLVKGLRVFNQACDQHGSYIVEKLLDIYEGVDSCGGGRDFGVRIRLVRLARGTYGNFVVYKAPRVTQAVIMTRDDLFWGLVNKLRPFLHIYLFESYGCAPNTLQFRNRLGAGHTLIVKCRSNRRISQGANYVSPNSIYSFPVKEKGSNRIVWTCELNDAKSKTFLTIWRAYRGAARARCGQICEYIVELKRCFLSEK
uniref:Uncharacterized protein n=1 Tax=Brassica oleracea var. oleracea TaxID=109376 RepID=A0A0D3AKY6_BRAOL